MKLFLQHSHSAWGFVQGEQPHCLSVGSLPVRGLTVSVQSSTAGLGTPRGTAPCRALSPLQLSPRKAAGAGRLLSIC